MSAGMAVTSDRQLGRLLQIGVVLEEVVEARAYKHYNALSPAEREAIDDRIVELLEEAAEESADHRRQLESLIEELDAESIPYRTIEGLVEDHWGGTETSDFDDILYDQLNGEETAYKFYDDLIASIEASDASFGIDRDRLLATLRRIRDEEEDGVREVTELMDDRGGEA